MCPTIYAHQVPLTHFLCHVAILSLDNIEPRLARSIILILPPNMKLESFEYLESRAAEDPLARCLFSTINQMPIRAHDKPSAVSKLMEDRGTPYIERDVEEALSLIAFLSQPTNKWDFASLRAAAAEFLRKTPLDKKSLSQRRVFKYDIYHSQPKETPEPVLGLSLASAILYLGLVSRRELKALVKNPGLSADWLISGKYTTGYAYRQPGADLLKMAELQRFSYSLESLRARGFISMLTHGVYDVGPTNAHNFFLSSAKSTGGFWSALGVGIDPDWISIAFKDKQPIILDTLRALQVAGSMHADLVLNPKSMEIPFKFQKMAVGKKELVENFIDYFWRYVYSLTRPVAIIIGNDRGDLIPIEHSRGNPFGSIVVQVPIGINFHTTDLIKKIKSR